MVFSYYLYTFMNRDMLVQRNENVMIFELFLLLLMEFYVFLGGKKWEVNLRSQLNKNDKFKKLLQIFEGMDKELTEFHGGF